MTKRKYNNILVLVVFALYVAYYRFFLSGSQSNIVDFINVAVIAVLAFISILLYGFRRDKLTIQKKKILITTVTEVLIFLAISYGLGIVSGYLKNSYALDALSIFENIFIPILLIIGIEVFRYTVLNANRDKKIVLYITTILIIILELTMALNNKIMYDFETTFKITSSIILPIIIKNASLSYITIHGGLKTVLFYRLVMDIYMFVMPIIPDLGDYLTSVIGILLPTFVYMYSARIVDDKTIEVLDDEPKKKGIRLADIPSIVFIVVLVVLISGKFTYAILGVGSESMMPKIAKGDAVIYKQVKSEKDIKVGDILVFKSGSKMIIHRLVEIKEDSGTNYFITKGDANNSTDNINLTIENIKGRVVFKIKYIAYPNLWLKDMIDKE